MGEMYLARAQGAAGFEKLVTAKILRRHVSASRDRITDLLREAFIGVRLDHENIVQVLDLDEHDGAYFIVMEYVRGFALRELITSFSARGERLPVRAVAHVGRCIADALEYVHRVRGPQRRPLGLIHRDVSPSNILLGAEGRIKLSDFGVATVARDTTRPGTVIGKPRYLPPKARHGEAATQAWDVYALGVVLLGALAGDSDGEQDVATSDRACRRSPSCGRTAARLRRSSSASRRANRNTACRPRPSCASCSTPRCRGKPTTSRCGET